MKVFVDNIDKALGRNISRLFAYTPAGIRKLEDDFEAEEEIPLYTVVGTLSVPQLGKDKAVFKKARANKKGILNIADTHLPSGIVPHWIQEVVNSDAVIQAVMSSDIIIFDITNNLAEAKKCFKYLLDNKETYNNKLFIAVSSVITWACTKSDTEIPFNEDDYKKRKSSAKYKDQLAFEKDLIKCKEEMLKTYVVSSGLIYHAGDSLFHFLLKDAWEGKNIKCFEGGSNNLPMIHVWDLANIVIEVAELLPEKRYILAVDDSKSTLLDIVNAINENIGTQSVLNVDKNQVFLLKDISQVDYDHLTINLKMDQGCVKEMIFEWKYENGFIENISNLIADYRNFFNLNPIKILIHGPPFSGKTFYSKKIALYYSIHYLNCDEIVEEHMKNLEKLIASSEENEEMKIKLDELQKANGKYPENLITPIVREVLLSKKVQNQGYVLDGFPATKEEANLLFAPTEEDDKVGHTFDVKNFPQYVFSLEIADDIIRTRANMFPESLKYSEEVLLKRIEEFRKANGEEGSVVSYFDENEVCPITLSVQNLSKEQVFDRMLTGIGQPHNYGLTQEQLLEIKKKEEDEKFKLAMILQEERLKNEREEIDRLQKSTAEWSVKLEEIKKKEIEILKLQSAPLRVYLVKNVMPTITEGLIEVCKVRPQDPVDFLAEFLFTKSKKDTNSIENIIETLEVQEATTTDGLIKVEQPETILANKDI